MALLVLAFAVALGELGRPPARRAIAEPHPRRAMVRGADPARRRRASSSTASRGSPGSRSRCPIWLALELATGRPAHRRRRAARRRAPPPRGDRRGGGRRGRRGRRLLGRPALGVRRQGRRGAGVGRQAQLAGVPRRGARHLAGGRLPGRPRRRRRRLSGAGARACWPRRSAPLAAVRRRDWGLVAMGASAVIVYVGRRAVRLDLRRGQGARGDVAAGRARGALRPVSPRGGERRGRRRSRPATSSAAIVARRLARASTFLALRAAPVGFDQRGNELESLAGLVQGRSVAFLGVDRFAGYWLRGTLMRSPGGYVPAEVKARPKKIWQQGLAMDFDTLSPRRLDEFDYAITTTGRLPVHRAAELQAGRPDRLVRALEAHRGRRRAAGDRQGRHARAAVLDCADRGRAAARRAARGRPRPCSPSPVVSGPGRLEPAARRSTPRDAPRQSLDLGRRALAALAPVPQPGAADRLGRRVDRSTCRRRSTACT